MNSFPFLSYAIISFLYLWELNDRWFIPTDYFSICFSLMYFLCPSPSKLLSKQKLFKLYDWVSYLLCFLKLVRMPVRTARKWADKRGIQGLSQRMAKHDARTTTLSSSVREGVASQLLWLFPIEPEHGLRILASVVTF